MIWFVLALAAAICWAVGAVLVKKGFESIPPLWNNIANNVLALVIWIPVILVLSRFCIQLPSLRVLLIIIAAAALFQFFYYSLFSGQVSLTGTIIAAYPMFTIVLSHLFLGERLSALQYLAVGLILSGGVAVAFPNRKLAVKIGSFSWVLWGLIGAGCLGTGDFLSKFSINRIGAYSHILFFSFVAVGVSGVNYLIDKPNRAAPCFFSSSFLPTFAGVVLHVVGALCFFLAFDYGPVSLISPVSSVYPALMAVLAIRFLKDTVAVHQGIGIGVITGGLIAIGFSGF